MAARTTREAARARIRAAFEKALDQVIPDDESAPLRGRTFIEWEDQADAFDQAVTTTLLEERAALEDTAQVSSVELGHCPHCGSDRLYLQQAPVGNQEVRTPHGPVVLGRQSVRCRACGRSFWRKLRLRRPPQARDWSLPMGVPLSPKAYRRVAREAVTQPFAKAAAALNEDWGVGYDGKQIQRWAQVAGEQLLAQQAAEREAYQRGRRPAGPKNDPQLLVIGMDGGRVQNREKNSQTGSRWREDKVLTISSYLPGDPRKDQAPQPLVTTYLATMEASDDFGVLARLEAERRGIRQARHVVVIGDGAAWIDTLHQRHFGSHVRIVDWYHAAEHLHAVARAAHPEHAAAQKQLADRLRQALWDGQVQNVIQRIQALADHAGSPRQDDPADHPRRVLAQNVGYFQRHAAHMNYPEYRERGWPIGSGMTEAGVKQFNKRVKGTEQFWRDPGVEPILALRSLWLSDDDRWDHYWLCRSPLRSAA